MYELFFYPFQPNQLLFLIVSGRKGDDFGEEGGGDEVFGFGGGLAGGGWVGEGLVVGDEGVGEHLGGDSGGEGVVAIGEHLAIAVFAQRAVVDVVDEGALADVGARVAVVVGADADGDAAQVREVVGTVVVADDSLEVTGVGVGVAVGGEEVGLVEEFAHGAVALKVAAEQGRHAGDFRLALEHAGEFGGFHFLEHGAAVDGLGRGFGNTRNT